jgi:hypothetical protein
MARRRSGALGGLNGGVLVMLQAYFDASSRPSGIFSVAGYAFAKTRLKKFDKEWWALFGMYDGCHMKDLTHGTGNFKGVDTTQAGELLKRAIAIIHKRISYGIVVSCETAEMNSLLPTFIQGFEHVYPVCCHLAMLNLGTHLEDAGRQEKVSYFFESGDAFSASAHKFMSKVSDTPVLSEAYRYHSHAFIPKDSALALQAADVLAWEWAKYYDETIVSPKRPIRRSLSTLLKRKDGDFDDARYHVMHITGEPLQSWAQKVTNLGLMELAEQNSQNSLKGKSGPV